MHPEAALVPSMAVFVAAVWAYVRELIPMVLLVAIAIVTLLAVLNYRQRKAMDEYR